MTLTCGASSVSADVMQNGIDIMHSPLRNTVQVAANGVVVGSPPTVYETMISITFRLSGQAEQEAFREFIVNTCGVRGNVVTLTPDSGVDLSEGDTEPVDARVWSGYNEPMRGFNLWYVDVTFRKEVT